MSYTIKIKSSAKREIKRLPTSVQVRITKKLEELEMNPRPPDVKKLQGYEKTYRVRVGEYRIVYEIEDDILLVWVIEVGHRSSVYR